MRVIETWDWSTTTATIRNIPILNLLLGQLGTFVPLNLYKYLTYRSIGLRVTLNTTSMYKGLLGVHFVPGDVLSTHWKNSVGLSQYQSAYIDASSSEVLETELPWVFTYPKIESTYVGRSSGQLCLYPHLPLRSDSLVGTDVTVTVTIEAWLIDPVLHDQVGTGGFPLPADVSFNDAVIAFPRIVCQGPGKVVHKSPVEHEAAQKSEKGALTSVAETVRDVSALLSPIPVIGTIAAGINVVASAAASVFSWFGLSKPPAVATPQYMLSRNSHYSNTFHGVEMSQPLSTNIEPLVASDPLLVGEKDDTLSLYDMAHSPSVISKFTILTTAIYGTKLFQIPVNPMEFFAGFGTQRFGSHLGYAASFFTAWSGDLNYKFIFASTKFQTFRIAIVWTPSAPVTYSQDFRQEKYDISGTSSIDMIVPWISKSPYRNMRVPNNADTDLAMSNGFLSVWCLAPIVNNTASVPAAIDCLVFSAGGASLRFARYRSPCLSGLTTTTALYSPVLAQGAFGATTLGVQQRIIDEDNIVSLRECAKRRSFTLSDDLSVPGLKTLFSSTSTFNLAYILRKFRYFRGAFIISYVSVTTGQIFTLSREAGANWELAQIRIHTTDNAEGSFTIPFTEEEGVLGTGACFGDTSPLLQVFLSKIGASSNGDLRFFIHMTDDFTTGFKLVSPILSGNFTF